MKKLLILAAIFAVSSAAGQNEQKESIVVSSYGSDAPREQPRFYQGGNFKTNKWRFALDVGYSYRTAKIAEELSGPEKDFVRRMRDGLTYGGDVHGFVGEIFGIGARFSGYNYTHSEWGLEAKVNTLYVGPSGMWRLLDGRGRNAWVGELSLGYVSYNQHLVSDSTEEISKGGFGSTFEIGYDIRLGTNSTFLGFKISAFSGSVRLFNYKTNENVLESLDAINFGVGLRF